MCTPLIRGGEIVADDSRVRFPDRPTRGAEIAAGSVYSNFHSPPDWFQVAERPV
jgi:hypothetical protein